MNSVSAGILMLAHWRLLAISTASVGLLALLVSLLILPRRYESTALLLMSGDRLELSFDPKLKSMSEERPDIATRKRSLETLALSPQVAVSVIEKLSARLEPAQRDPYVLRERIEVATAGEIIRISARTGDPALSSDLANAWADVVRELANSTLRSSEANLATLQENRKEALATFRKSQEAFSTFISERDTTGSLQAQLNAKQARLGELHALRSRLERGIRDVDALVEEFAAPGSNPGTLDFSSALAALAVRLSTLESSGLPPLQFDLGQAANGNGAGLHSVALTIRALRRSSEQLRKGLSKVVTALEDPDLHGDIRKLQGQIEKLQAEKRELTGARDVAWETHVSLARKAEESRLSRTLEERVAVRLASTAVPNPDPASPKAPVYTMGGASAGFGLTLLVLLLRFAVPSTAQSSVVTRAH